jgi:hypothetical protein
MLPTNNPKRTATVTLDDESIARLRWLSKALGDVGVSAAIRYCAAKEYQRQQGHKESTAA